MDELRSLVPVDGTSSWTVEPEFVIRGKKRVTSHVAWVEVEGTGARQRSR